MKKHIILSFLGLSCAIMGFSQTDITLFQAAKAGNNVVISWETIEDRDIAYYKVEQIVGNEVHILGQVASQHIANEAVMYNFSAMNAMSLPSHCYRLSAVDVKGNATYLISDSACITVNRAEEAVAHNSQKRGKMKVSTNNSTHKAQISMPKQGKYTLTIYDLDGGKIGKVHFDGADYELDMSQYVKSAYYIETTDMRNVYVEKIAIF